MADHKYSSSQHKALILSESAAQHDVLSRLAQLCDYRVTPLTGDISLAPAVDILLIDHPSVTGKTLDILPGIKIYMDRHKCAALVWTDADRLDAIYGWMPADRTEYLFGHDDVQAITAMSWALNRGVAAQLHDRNRDNDFTALRQISNELASFAQTLSKMATQGMRDSAAPTYTPFRPQPPLDGAPPTYAAITATEVRNYIRVRRMRDQYFGAMLFADPAWDILLDLFAAGLEDKPISVSSLCIAAAVPATTALRWIGAMTENGMLHRNPDPIDARRVFISLSPTIDQKMRQYFTDVKIHMRSL